MKKLLNIFALGLLLTLGACSSVQYNTTRVQSLDFSHYKTYGWLPPVDSLSKDYFNNDIANTNILEAANQELEAMGLQYSKENPDLLFRYISIVNNKSRAVYGSSYYGWGGWGPWGWYSPYGWYGYGGYHYPIGSEKYRYAHLIIEAVDRQSNSVIWQARGSSELRTPEAAINKLPEVVSGIFKQYPMKRKK
ncbi:DUF4136 domain-containing protein [Sphingobacterium sp. UT-1RO-CII-1]|uniref:DUF4136 domain-containing protein n=1 Tax=Sphingobacterium sp. UT-1RO-CII-1 TaxID=2995225 RepID=UPI00227B0DB8|nr:DUF4136 domain-containing protein [Sphingobacterium sp. UT-1RO-CII-1]MCY4778348.1 DUF4136 domain-containing protein [Sphingobacterium sp. UT-1RO-CII-1]